MARICFLGRSGSRPVGVDRYSSNLIPCIARIGKHEYFSTFDESYPGVANIKVLPASDNFLIKGLHRTFLLPLSLRKYQFDLIHGMIAWIPPFTPGAKKAMTVHDLSPLVCPEHFLRYSVMNFRHGVANSIRGSNLLIADSENTKKDLMEILSVPEEKIAVALLGVEHEKFRRIEDAALLEAARNRYSLPDKFVLSVGTIEPRKNYLGLVNAFLKVRKAFPEHKLVIAGKKGWKYEPLLRFLDSMPELKKDVLMIDYVSDADLPLLYNLADLFAYVSFYEGFGLPPLEAMACGAPVIISDNSSLPEVVGEAGLYVRAEDTDGIAEAMMKMLGDKGLRRKHSALSLERAKRFTWAETARKTVEAYDKVLGLAPGSNRSGF